MASQDVDFSNRKKLEDTVSEDGVAGLLWDVGGEKAVLLEQSEEASFLNPVLRYKGRDQGSVITGLPEGVHFFRLRLPESETVSPPLRVEVKFVSRVKLFTLLAIGGVVVLATVLAIVLGYLKTREDEGELES